MREALACIREGKTPENMIDFKDLRALVVFPEYDAALERLEKE